MLLGLIALTAVLLGTLLLAMFGKRVAALLDEWAREPLLRRAAVARRWRTSR